MALPGGGHQRSFLTLNVYLNGVDTAQHGGATRFYADCTPAESHALWSQPASVAGAPLQHTHRIGASVAPRAGRAVVFAHDMLHDGERLRAGVKYLLRTDVVYVTGAPAPAGAGVDDATAHICRFRNA